MCGDLKPIGSQLQKVYYGKPKGVYLALLANDWTGDVRYLREAFFDSLRDYKVMEKNVANRRSSRLESQQAGFGHTAAVSSCSTRYYHYIHSNNSGPCRAWEKPDQERMRKIMLLWVAR